MWVYREGGGAAGAVRYALVHGSVVYPRRLLVARGLVAAALPVAVGVASGWGGQFPSPRAGGADAALPAGLDF